MILIVHARGAHDYARPIADISLKAVCIARRLFPGTTIECVLFRKCDEWLTLLSFELRSVHIRRVRSLPRTTVDL